MGIRFNCQTCGGLLNIKEHLAGKRGICPKCGARIQIPAKDGEATVTPGTADTISVQLTSSAATSGPSAPPATTPARTAADAAPLVISAVGENAVPASPTAVAPQPEIAPAVIAPIANNMPDPIAEAPDAQWYVAPAGTKDQYGPAKGDVLRAWIVDGRVAPDSLIWREGWADWRVASKVLPQMQPVTLPPHAPSTTPAPAQRRPAWSPIPLNEKDVPESPRVATGRVLPSDPERKRVPKTILWLVGVVLLMIPILIYVVIQANSKG